MPCLSYDQLRELLDGPGQDSATRPMVEHLHRCHECRRKMDELSDDAELSSWRSALRAAAVDASEPSSDLVHRILRYSVVRETQDRSESATDRTTESWPAFSVDLDKRVGGFQLLEELGRGGMGVVYKARDVELDRTVAVKFVPLHDLDDKGRTRFFREARAAASVRHDYVVAVHAVDTDGDRQPYLVMEFVDGSTLRDWIKQGAFTTPRQVAELIAKAATGLQAVHEAGLIHCDVKPSNILLTGERDSLLPKITDFGLARLITSERTRTLDGMFAGTPSYMSPEQLRGELELTPASDVYSLGATLYESLTGVVPFSGSPHMVLRQIEHVEPRRPGTLNELVPRDLDTICLKALAKEPDRRYATAKEFCADLERWLRGDPIVARPAGIGERLYRWARRNRRIAALSAAVFFLLITLTVVSSTAAYLISVEQRETTQQKFAAEQSDRESQQHAAAAKEAQQQAELHAQQASEQRDLAIAAHLNLVRGVHDRLAATAGTLSLRKELLESAATGLEKIVAASQPDESDRALFLARQRLSELYLELGRTDDARAEAERALGIAQALYERAGGAERSINRVAAQDAQEDLALAWTNMAELHLKSLDYAGSIPPLTEAARLLDELAAVAPERATLNNRIRVQINLGDASLRRGEQETAELHYGRAFELAEQPQLQGQLTPQTRRTIESVMRRLGDAALMRGELGRSVDWYQRALDSADRAGLAEFSPQERQGLVDACGRMGLVLAWLGKADEAEAVFRRGWELNEAAEQADPENQMLIRKSAIIQQRFADVSWSRGDYEAMHEHLQRALAAHRGLAERDPSSTMTQSDLVVCLEQLARLATRREQYDQSRSWYGEAQKILQARRDAGTLTDPVSLNFEKEFAGAQQVLQHLPAVLESSELPEGLSDEVTAALLAERAIVAARRGESSRAAAELKEFETKLRELDASLQAPMQLAVARAHALCAVGAENPGEHQAAGVAALEKYVAADPFNATYLGFEPELAGLRSHPGFQKLTAKVTGE